MGDLLLKRRRFDKESKKDSLLQSSISAVREAMKSELYLFLHSWFPYGQYL